jgi:hypothetical protein
MQKLVKNRIMSILADMRHFAAPEDVFTITLDINWLPAEDAGGKVGFLVTHRMLADAEGTAAMFIQWVALLEED